MLKKKKSGLQSISSCLPSPLPPRPDGSHGSSHVWGWQMGLPWTISPSICAFGRVGSPPVSPLRLGGSNGWGSAPGQPLEVEEVLLHCMPYSFLSAGDMEGLPTHQDCLPRACSSQSQSLWGV